MLGSPLPAPATTQTSTSSATPSSPARPSRLRGLSNHLRNYTRDHLHSSTTNHASSRLESPPLIRSTTSPDYSPRAGRSRASSDISPRQPLQNSEASSLTPAQTRTTTETEPRQPPSTSIDPASPETSTQRPSMTRSRTLTALGPTPTTTTTASTPVNAERITLHTAQGNGEATGQNEIAREAASSTSNAKDTLPTIRFIPHIETRSSRPSLQFTALSKTLKTPNTIVRVGRYSERDISSSDENIIPVGFKSKVVSRRHCEFWCANGQWYIKDVQSSSGTFLNHVRLSAPGLESRPFPVNDGDVIQLGIDFKGGEEIIFRCVKIRIECNRGWQKSLNNFNTSAHQRILRNATRNKVRDSDAGSVNSSECSICLNRVSPCQALFVAPCGHLWHYKCIRNLVHGPNYPHFLCPNCRLVADLDADVEPPEDQLYEDDIDGDTNEVKPSTDPDAAKAPTDKSSSTSEEDESAQSSPQQSDPTSEDDLAQLADETSIDLPEAAASGSSSNQAEDDSHSKGTKPVAIATPPTSRHATQDFAGAKSSTPTSHSQFALAGAAISADLMTPRNEAGPFILDGDDEQTRQNIRPQRALAEDVS